MNLKVNHKKVMILSVLSLFLPLFFSPVSQAKPMEKWLKSRKITHATGILNGEIYSNSVEALKNTIQAQKTVVEIDFMYTSDGVLVCNHGWKTWKRKAPTYATYMKSQTEGNGTPMDAKKAIELLGHTDIHLIIDTQEKNTAKVYQNIKDLCEECGVSSYMNNIIPQIYRESDYKKIQRVYPFKECILECYKKNPKNITDIKNYGKICKRNNIQYIALYSNLLTKKRVDLLHKYGLIVIAHTVDSKKEYKQLRKIGVDAVMSNTF